MPIVTEYQGSVETNMYWNLLKGLNNTVKFQLFRKLKQSLIDETTKDVECNEVAQVAYFELVKKFDTYKKYKVGWDGADAVPLTKKVVHNFGLILDQIDKNLLRGLTIFPETNGTLLIDSTTREAGISLGDNNFSYYEIIDNKIIGDNKIPFSVKAVINIISMINKHS